jgi:branched-chain amino acid aminotransferase
MSLAVLDFVHHPNPNAVSDAERARLLENPGFGSVFTDHMVLINYDEGKGWHDARVAPYAPIPMDPASAVLHYAQEIFEGLKAYRLCDGTIGFFRPDANARRFRQSAERLAMAQLPEDLFVQSIMELVRTEAAWVPQEEGKSLYLRPFMIATEPFLGMRPSTKYLYVVIASPVASYFKRAIVSAWVSHDYVRAAPGGTGAAKCGGNYAASLAAQRQAYEQGCDQVVFLDAVERRWVEEMGGMHIFFVMNDGTLLTPPLSGTILPGVTRNSILALARERGLTVKEERYSFAQWQEDARSSRLTECFACGTAAVITTIGKVQHKDGSFVIRNGETGTLTHDLREQLVGIQRGQRADPHGWVVRLQVKGPADVQQTQSSPQLGRRSGSTCRDVDD